MASGDPRPLPAHELTDLAADDENDEPETLAPTPESTTIAVRRGEALIDPPPPF